MINKILEKKPSLEEVVEEFLPLINYWASKYVNPLNPVLSKEDLISAGIIGLIEAYRRYDPSKRVKFRTYAEYRIKGAILDEIRKVGIIPRSIKEKANQLEEKIKELFSQLGRMPEEEEIAQEMNISLDDYYKMLENIKGITFIDLETLKQRVSDISEEDVLNFLAGSEKDSPHEIYALKELQEQLEKALELLSEKERLVLALYYYEDLTMKEISKILGYTESRISQIHNQAILKLRSLLNK
ncbi:MAG: FliA/WhiG family RNA polymerase sigma factor [Thermodesulfobacteriaceae bacterium]|nr:FliA/WhiG family RNA polymerase sigma factor [Thermodesulfobacteriaceae bacterium]